MAPSVLRSRFARSPASKATLRRRAGECLANELIRLGPTYVKIGQIVSCRENLLPQEYVSALARLQDRVPSFDGARAAQLAAQAWAGEAGVGGEVGGNSGNDDGGGGGGGSRNDAATAAKKKRKKNVSPGGGGGSTDANADDAAATLDKVFQFFDTTPLAAASLGQVHRATLRPGVLAAARKRQKQLQLQQRQQQQQQQLQQQQLQLQQPPQGEEQQPERMIGSSSSSSSSGGDTTAASTTSTIDDDGGDDGGALEVCVKVQREGLRLIYDKDLQLLGKMAMALDRFGVGVGGMGQRWAELFEEASEVLYQEIDYRAEAASALRFGEAFKTLPWATTPKVSERPLLILFFIHFLCRFWLLLDAGGVAVLAAAAAATGGCHAVSLDVNSLPLFAPLPSRLILLYFFLHHVVIFPIIQTNRCILSCALTSFW
jgi:hypothetical protein